MAVAVTAGCGGHPAPVAAVAPLDSDHDSIPDAQDCAPMDVNRWQLLPHDAVDLDGDDHRVASAGQVCSGAVLPARYFAGQPDPSDVDCDDADASAWRWMTTYADLDRDGIGAGAGTVRCVGSTAPSGYSLFGYDPSDDPGDPNAVTVSNQDMQPWQLSTP